MHAAFVVLLQILYTVSMLGLTIYGAHALWLTWQLRQPRRKVPAAPPPAIWPRVTVQLPIYNEEHVLERLVAACAMQDYPHELLQIQVLDDSTDQTRALAERCAEQWRSRGVCVEVVRRSQRSGYKAGALAYALPAATGEFIAIFDADFVPGRDFLRAAIPYFYLPGYERVAFVQGRWGHLNRSYSALTAGQALAIDGHFAVEQAGRQAGECLFGFNGSAGIWRRACLDDPAVGGWQADTLCEDLDLSYRAQLAGWRPCYLNHIEAPAELPPQLGAFKRQQSRWAKGSIQTLRKVGPRLWRSALPLRVRLVGLVHLGSYLIHPLLLLNLLISLPILLLHVNPARYFGLLSFTTFGPPLLYAVAEWRLHRRRWLHGFAWLPLLMLLGTGLSLNNSRAVWEGLREQGGHFLRTPKFHVENTGDAWRSSRYRLPIDGMVYGEAGLMLYALAAFGVAASADNWWSAVFIGLYVVGFGLMVGVGVWQAAQRGRPAFSTPGSERRPADTARQDSCQMVWPPVE